jgi:alpha-N-arabinofuranosidase
MTGTPSGRVDFTRDEWAKALARAYLTDQIIARHAAIMDKYDPGKQVALAVDEWGGWFSGERTPSSLYLESTLRDALIAGLSLNIFNQHADRVRMANIAQMVNVIQSLVLTRGGQMVVTPTWHVFDMYKVHQGATQVPLDLTTPDYVEGATRLPTLHASASRDGAGKVHISIVNMDPARAAPIDMALAGLAAHHASAETITAEKIDTRIMFDGKDPFVPRAIASVALANGHRR